MGVALDICKHGLSPKVAAVPCNFHRRPRLDLI